MLNYYPIRVELDESLGNSILAGNSIFTVLKNNKAVHEFNIKEKKICIHKLFELTGKFWLSGSEKCIYLWNQERNEIKRFYDFPG